MAERGILTAADDLSAWDEFAARSAQGSLFSSSWWLKAVAGDRFEIHLLRSGGEIVCGLPAVRTHLRFHDKLGMPPMTQVLGALLPPPAGASYERNLSREMELLEELVGSLPEVGQFSINFHPAFTNWLPFYWAGYAQTTRYTYVLEDLSDPGSIFAQLAHSKRKNIRKAEQEVAVREDLEPDRFYDSHAATLAAQGKRISHTRQLFRRIHDSAVERGAGKTWYAADAQGNLHAAIFVVWDACSAYYLVSTIDPAFRNSGAATLLVKRAIEHVALLTRRFDFEGSMIKGVEGSFRKFGARQVPYFRITRDRRGALPRSLERLQMVSGDLARLIKRRRRP